MLNVTKDLKKNALLLQHRSVRLLRRASCTRMYSGSGRARSERVGRVEAAGGSGKMGKGEDIRGESGRVLADW